MDNNIGVPQTIKKIEILHDPVISFLSYYPQGMKTSTSKFTVAKIWEQPVSTKKWMEKEDVIYRYRYKAEINEKRVAIKSEVYMDILRTFHL